MPTTIVVGGQYGSEGKGKVVALLASRTESPWIVRCGGPNSGHTVTINGEDVVLRQVPSCPDPQKAMLFLSAGCAVDEAVLVRELDALKVQRDQIVVDPRAVIVTERSPSRAARPPGHCQHMVGYRRGIGAEDVSPTFRRSGE